MSKRGWIAIHVCDDLATIKNGVRRDCSCKRAVNLGVIGGAGARVHIQHALLWLQVSTETGVRLLLLLLLFIIKQN